MKKYKVKFHTTTEDTRSGEFYLTDDLTEARQKAFQYCLQGVPFCTIHKTADESKFDADNEPIVNESSGDFIELLMNRYKELVSDRGNVQ